MAFLLPYLEKDPSNRPELRPFEQSIHIEKKQSTEETKILDNEEYSNLNSNQSISESPKKI